MRWLKMFWGEDFAAFKKTVRSILRQSPDELALMSAIFTAKQLGMNPQGLCLASTPRRSSLIAVIQKDGRYTLHPSNTKISAICQKSSTLSIKQGGDLRMKI